MKSRIKKPFSPKKTIACFAVVMASAVLFAKSATAGTIDGDLLVSGGCMGHTSPVIAEKEAKYHRTIVTYANKYGVNPNLIKAVVSVESCFDHKAVSPAGAEGLMQLMPATAKWLGVTDSTDSEQNLEAGIRYLSTLRKRYNNDNKLALAAYNAGPGNVKKYKGIPPFPETQSYVVKVEKRFQQYQMLDQVALNTY